MNEKLIEIVDLKKYFKVNKGYLHAVDGINLSISKGKTLGVVGESGCGKSTLGQTLIRLTDPTSGQVLFDGVDIASLKRRQLKQYRTKMQMIFQDPYSSLNPRMNVAELIAEPRIVNKLDKDKKALQEKVVETMERVGLDLRLMNTYPHELDGGRRQRIGIARALAVDPQFIVCDEPVSALDVSIQAQILNLLMDLQDELGLTYVFITHNLAVVKHISDEIAVMYLGKCVEHAPSKVLFENPKHPYTKALLKAIPVASMDSIGKKRELIKGELTSPINPKEGCRFYARCPYASEKCMGADIPLVEQPDGSKVACTLY